MKNKNMFLAFIILCASVISCGKDSDLSSGTFQVTYKLEGPETSMVQVQYTPTITDHNNIPDEYEETVTPPWSKTVTLINAVSGAGFSASVDNGQPGAKYKMTILDKDSNPVKSGEFILDGDGFGVLLLNYYK